MDRLVLVRSATKPTARQRLLRDAGIGDGQASFQSLRVLEGRKQDGLLLLAGTLAILFAITAAALVTLVVVLIA
jgi:hypothetical protein